MWDQICRSQWPTVTQSCPSMWLLELGRWHLSHGTRGRSKQGPQEREETQSFETLLFPALWVAGGHWASWLVEDGDSDDQARIYIWHVSLSHPVVCRQPSALPGVHCSCADGPHTKVRCFRGGFPGISYPRPSVRSNLSLFNPNALPGFVLQTKQMPHYTVAAFLRSWGFIYWWALHHLFLSFLSFSIFNV